MGIERGLGGQGEVDAMQVKVERFLGVVPFEAQHGFIIHHWHSASMAHVRGDLKGEEGGEIERLSIAANQGNRKITVADDV
jgi:hypothetical protein